MNKQLQKKAKRKMYVGTKQYIIFCICMLAFPVAHWAYFDLGSEIESYLFLFKEFNYDTLKYEFLPSTDLFRNFRLGFELYFGGDGALPYVLNGLKFYLVRLPLIATGYMAVYVVYKRFPTTNFIFFMRYVPAMLSGMVVINVVKHVLGSALQITLGKTQYALFVSTGGMQGTQFGQVGFEHPLSTDSALPILLGYVVLNGFCGDVAYTAGLMNNTSKDLVDYGQLEGLSYWGEFTTIVMPTIWPVVEMGLYGIFVGWFMASGPLYELYQGSAPESVKTLAYYIQSRTLEVATNDGDNFYCISNAMSAFIAWAQLPIVFLTKAGLERISPLRDTE